MGFFFMTGTTVEDFGQGGAATRDRDWLNILVKTPASWSADPLHQSHLKLLGPAAFLGFNAPSVHRTSCCSTMWAGGRV